MTALPVAVVLVLAPWVLWALYVLVMGLYRAKLAGRLTTTTTIMGAPWLLIGLAVDVAVNFTVASIVFLEPPWELLVTSRLQRYVQSESGWRRRIAVWICDTVLDPFDPTNNHC